MLIVNASAPKGPEIAVQRHLKPLTGVLIGNAKIPRDNGEAREVDAIVLTPTRVFVVEAKGFKGSTANTGVLEVPLNGDWTIGGEVAQFYGKDWPNVQARQSAQTLAGLLQSQTSIRSFVTAIASISAKSAEIPGGPLLLADVMVCMDHTLPEAVSTMPVLGRVNKPITPDHVFETLRALRLPERMWPTRERVEQEWAKAPQQTPQRAQKATPSTSPRSGQVGPAASGEERTFEQIMAEARARRGGKTPQEQTAEILRKLGVGQPGQKAGPNVQRLAAVVNGQPMRGMVNPEPVPAATKPPASNKDAAIGCLMLLGIAAVLIFGMKFLWGAVFNGDDEMDRAEATFMSAVTTKYPKVDLTQDTMVCRRGEKSALFEDTDFFCDIYGKRGDRTVKFNGVITSDLRVYSLNLVENGS